MLTDNPATTKVATAYRPNDSNGVPSRYIATITRNNRRCYPAERYAVTQIDQRTGVAGDWASAVQHAPTEEAALALASSLGYSEVVRVTPGDQRPQVKITIETSVARPRPTTTGVPHGIDYDADLWITDEAGVRHHWAAGLTYAPDPGRGDLVPYGNAIDHWMGDELVSAIRRPWVAAHPRLVEVIINSLGDGPGDETIEVTL
jgi:hypothetical protein